MNVAAESGQQVRLNFTSAEAGNDPATEVGTLADPDGGLALRLQAENGSDSLAGLVGRYDKGIRFVSTAPGVTFDLRDLVGGAQRGAAFKMGVLRTKGAAGATGSTGRDDDALRGATCLRSSTPQAESASSTSCPGPIGSACGRRALRRTTSRPQPCAPTGSLASTSAAATWRAPRSG